MTFSDAWLKTSECMEWLFSSLPNSFLSQCSVINSKLESLMNLPRNRKLHYIEAKWQYVWKHLRSNVSYNMTNIAACYVVVTTLSTWYHSIGTLENIFKWAQLPAVQTVCCSVLIYCHILFWLISLYIFLG